MEQPVDLMISLYRQMARIRRFEETVLEQFHKGVFYGTTHTYIGQEANAVGILANLQQHDIVVSNHRCHGHFLAYGGDMRALFAELMGKATGVCGGRGGSQHLHWRNFYSNGILGGTAPLATGMALAEKFQNTGAVTVIFLGDGALGEGVVYETLNLAALWQAPILFVVENNRIAQTTPFRTAFAGDIAIRFSGFGISVEELDSSDATLIQAAGKKLLDQVRQEQKPAGLVLLTHRFGPHSKGDDTRSETELNRIRMERDPLKILSARLSSQEIKTIQTAVEAEVSKAFTLALSDPFPQLPAQPEIIL